jgi:hypothetical protein
MYGLCNTQTITLKGQASELAGDSVGGTKLEKVMDATIISTVKHLKARFSSLLGKCSHLSYKHM